MGSLKTAALVAAALVLVVILAGLAAQRDVAIALGTALTTLPGAVAAAMPVPQIPGRPSAVPGVFETRGARALSDVPSRPLEKETLSPVGANNGPTRENPTDWPERRAAFDYTPNYWIGGSRIGNFLPGDVDAGITACDLTPDCVGFDFDGRGVAMRHTVPAQLWPNTRTDVKGAHGAYVRSPG
jgi:hypothetical protein